MNVLPVYLFRTKVLTAATATLLLLLFVLTTGCYRSTDSPGGSNSSADSAKPDPVEALATLNGITTKSKGDQITVLDLRDVPENKLPIAVAAALNLPQLQEIIVAGKAVIDPIALPLVGIPTLKRIRITDSKITDTTLEKIANQGQLELLYLTGSTEVTENGIGQLGQLTQLRNLRLSGSAVNDSSVQMIRSLSNLAALTLQQTDVTDEGIKAIESLVKIKELSLYGTPVTDAVLPTLAKLPLLGKLRLRGTQVTGESVTALETMPIVDLELAETNFGNSGMSSIAKMPQLEKINLWLTKIDDDGLAFLNNKTALKVLNLDNVPGITDQSIELISQLPQLELLHLGGTSVTPNALPALVNLNNLKTLIITRLNVTDEQAQELQTQMPTLERLDH